MSGTTAATPLTPDICVIGAGPAGLGVAMAAALFGVSVVLVERGGMGRERLNAGSLPVAALIAAGRRVHAAREAGRFGISTGAIEVSYAQVHDHVQRVVSSMAPNVSAERLSALGITLLHGEARFASRSTVIVGEQAIKARRFVVATGSRPILPQVAGLDTINTLTSETLTALTRLPERLLVFGGEPAAIELAQAMARLGSRVTLIETAELLPNQDPEAAMLVRRGLLRDGITLHEHATVLRASAIRGGARLTLESEDAEQTIEGSHVLVAAGRGPDIAALDLQFGGITSDLEGVIVDSALRTGNRRVFAIGGCIGGRGGPPSTQAAEHQAGLVLRNALFRLSAKVDKAAIPRLVQSCPEVASVGISEAEARRRGAVTVLRWPYAENDRARAEGETDGFVKLVTDRKGRILGATIVGAGAGELIAPWCMAVRRGLATKDMAELVVPSPSLSEVSRRAAASSYASLAVKPGIRRLIGFLRRFG